MFNEVSSPDSLQSLRNRLIREGSIVPDLGSQLAQKASEIVASIKEKIDNTLARMSASQDLADSLQRAYLLYQKALKRSFGYIGDGENEKRCSYFNILSFLNLFRIIEGLLKRKKNYSERIILARDGFFFAFKENMKNTP